MQDYKIRIPNADLRQQILEKAYNLGYNWYGIEPPVALLGAANKLYLSNNNITYGESNFVFENFDSPEISYQDFLRLGEIDVNNCKINFKTLSQSAIINFNNKLSLLGIIGYGQSNPPVIRVFGWPNYPEDASHLPEYMFIRNGKSVMVGTEYYFNSLPEREVTVEQIMQLQPTINNTTTEIMSGEITLKCITAPQKAKNITVDRDYTGILIDSDDSQVDTLREATHFRCVNNNGIEAKYKLSLFATIEPPRPQFPTWEQIERSIEVNDNNEVIAYFNDEEHIIYDNDYPEINSGMCCCGLNEINGIQSLHNSIDRNCNFDLLEDNTNQQRLKDLVFKKLINDAIEENSGAFRIFTLVSGHDAIDTLMKEIMDERGGVETEYRRSTSSSNDIKVFVINL